MMQQVNLYTQEFQPRRDPLNIKQILLLIFLSLLVGASISFYVVRVGDDLRAEKQTLEAQRNTQLASLDDLKRRYPVRGEDPELKNRLKRFEQDLLAKQRLLKLINEPELSNTAGFSEHLAGLARQRQTDLWLTGIRLSSGGSQIGLAGSTYQPDLVAKFIQRLRREEIFKGGEFQIFRMSRKEDAEELVDFSLMSSEGILE